ncbi:MAG TPA: PLP-dependent aminotransferase family protein [Treponemataceae bacterium]|nr:PLP-dependent aminotransferase family protein [Treponemataceae bacterium]HPS44471.1 PLP-dependent aminotransferase family protein [Treponemataceae bacterium]
MYGIIFDPESRLSQYRQLVDQLRARITEGSLPGGTRLASTRELSEGLKVARGIVLEAVEQLKMEGYLRTERGSGTFVRRDLVWNGSSAPSSLAPTVGVSGAGSSPSSSVPITVSGGRGATRDDAAVPREKAQPLSFAPGMPDLELFPRRQWSKCYQDAVEYASLDDLSYNRPSGRWELRQSIVRHLLETKGIKVGPERVVVTAGSSQAFAMLAQLFDHPRVAMEDPQAPFVRRVFQGLGGEMTYEPVDDEGIIPARIPAGPLDLIYVTPAHQFPVGGTLSAERRVALLERARESGAWIIEDDFDGEFRYEGHPVSPLQVMAGERVAYVGTFSKNVSPALRIGYVVLPPGLQARFKTLKRRWDLWNEGLQQNAMARFIDEGHLERHLRRCFRAYREKNSLLKRLVAERLAPEWEAIGGTTGMHLVLRRTPGGARETLGAGADAKPVADALLDRGILVERVAEYCRENAAYRDSIIVAFGNRTADELERLVDCLAALTRAR